MRVPYDRLEVDGETFDSTASKVHVVNSGMIGSGLKVAQTYALDDVLVDCFALDSQTTDTHIAAGERSLDLHAERAQTRLPTPNERSASRPPAPGRPGR